MKKVIFLTAMLITTLTQAQWWGNDTVKGNGEMTKEVRETSDYDEINVAGSFDVLLTSGSEGKIEVEAEANLMEYIIVETNGSKLKIKTEDGYNLRPSNGNSIVIRVPVEEIEELNLAGSGDVRSEITLKASEFETSLAGSGNISLDLEVSELHANIAGSGDIILSGSSDDFDCNIAGSGDIDAFDLKSRDVTVSIAGSGDANVYCDGILKASIVGSGDVNYKGNPTKEESRSMGSGDVSKAK
ncbi:head GIN domain-containing protein [Robertkochia aurantiaca]|uniref:head GIN domain-containing protein n=1 Tax=Robertkochia aurantiaca TaxID=2873700 RepID=UPI001CCC799D|nr:head GIN domain-containing protein [Robertkochia sp. 3YJGBD-33]